MRGRRLVKWNKRPLLSNVYRNLFNGHHRSESTIHACLPRILEEVRSLFCYLTKAATGSLTASFPFPIDLLLPHEWQILGIYRFGPFGLPFHLVIYWINLPLCKSIAVVRPMNNSITPWATISPEEITISANHLKLRLPPSFSPFGWSVFLFPDAAELWVLAVHVAQHLFIVSDQLEQITLPDLSVVGEHRIPDFRWFLVVKLFNGGRMEPEVVHLFIIVGGGWTVVIQIQRV